MEGAKGMLQLAPGWSVETARGPDWLFVRLRGPDDGNSEGTNLADSLWSLLQQQLVRRLVVEMDDLPVVRSSTLGQLVVLNKRIHDHGGLMRLCGLSDAGQQAVQVSRLDGCFPSYRNREEAVMGYRPKKPR
jgi:anti-anti-sigma factor